MMRYSHRPQTRSTCPLIAQDRRGLNLLVRWLRLASREPLQPRRPQPIEVDLRRQNKILSLGIGRVNMDNSVPPSLR